MSVHDQPSYASAPNVAGMGRTPPPATQGNAPDLRDGCALRLLACANYLSKRATALKSCCGATTVARSPPGCLDQRR
jgi:hypothetical protein